MEEVLKGKRILIVDDEPDILETLTDMLNACIIDTAPSFETAQKSLNRNVYDLAILDIMGVRGYDLLELAKERGVPALMLTSHAVSPDNLVRSIEGGAACYLPKEKIAEITTYLAEILESREKSIEKQGAWLSRLEPYFDMTFGEGWKEENRDFWKVFDKTYRPSRDELQKII